VVRDTTADGRGVAVVDGKTVFIDAALRGEEVTFRRRRKRKNYDEATLISVDRSAASRVTPRCEYFGVCGGCTLQHLDAPQQLALKQQAVLEALKRIGKVAPVRVLEPLRGKAFGYRRRGRLGARYVDKKGRVLVGFREKDKPYIADMHSCQTLDSRLAVLLEPLAELLAELTIMRAVPQIEVSAGDTEVALVLRALEPPQPADTDALRQFAQRHGVQLWLQSGGPDTLRPLEPSAPSELEYRLVDAGLRFRYGPLDFVQVNQEMNQLMVRRAMELLQPEPGQHVLDLFCGIGNFSLPVAHHGARVTGVEFDPAMVARASSNAALNQLEGTQFVAADLQLEGSPAPFWEQACDAVLLDPPRAGAREILPQIAATGARRIVYVSCHPGSLARDAGLLVAEHGYRLQAAGSMDMFPQTSHIEAMALFERSAR